MPTEAEISAAVKALHERREKSRLGNAPWPEIEAEVRIVLEAAEKERAMQDYHPAGHAAGSKLRTEDEGTARQISGRNKNPSNVMTMKVAKLKDVSDK